MGLPDRTRDFTSETLSDILRLLEGPTEESREFTRFWDAHAPAFDTVDFSAQAACIDAFVSRSRRLISVAAPARFREVFGKIQALDAAYAQDCENTSAELRAYAAGLDALLEAISGDGFPAQFDRAALETSLGRTARGVNPQREAFLQMLMEQAGLSRKDALLLWKVYGKGVSANLSADIFALPPPQSFSDPFLYVIALLLWVLGTLGYEALRHVDWDALWKWAEGNPDTAEEPPPVGTLGVGAHEEPYPPVPPDALPENAEDAYNRHSERGWTGTLPGATPNTGAGGTYANDGRNDTAILPETDADGNPIDYREFDVNNKVAGQDKDGERFVVGSDGKVYYTNDHYKTFVEVSP